MDATKVKSQPPVNSLTSAARPQAVQQKQEAQKRTAENQATQQAQTRKAHTEQPRPNVNGEGKMIGTRLSVTA